MEVSSSLFLLTLALMVLISSVQLWRGKWLTLMESHHSAKKTLNRNLKLGRLNAVLLLLLIINSLCGLLTGEKLVLNRLLTMGIICLIFCLNRSKPR